MKFSEFKRDILNKKFSPIYLLEGEETFFTERSISLLKSILTEPNLNFTTLSLEVKQDEILSSLSSFPIFDEHRIILIREFYPDDKSMKADLKQYFLSPSESSILVIANTKPCAFLKKYPLISVVDCVKSEPSVVARWVKEECLANSVEIDLETARLVGEYCLFSMTRVEAETKKLIAFSLSSGRITEKDVKELVARETEYKIYELTDYIAKKSFDKALDAVNEMLSKGETFQRLTISVYKYFSRLLHVAISDKNPTELAPLLGVKEYAVIKAKEQAKLFKVKSLKKAVDLLTDGDYKIKTGLITESSSFYLALFKIITQ